MEASARRVWLTWGGLLVLTAVTFGLSFAPLGAAHPVAALLIAAAKAALVLAVFMELAHARVSGQFALACAVLLLTALIALAVADVLSRQVLLLPPG